MEEPVNELFRPDPAAVPVTTVPATTHINDGDEKAAIRVYDRERIMNDMVNTGTVGALIGGFALSIFDRPFSLDSLEFATGIIIFLSVHLCTFSALSSAIIYRRVNVMSEEAAAQFAVKWAFVIKMPQGVFVIGCLCYLVGVILLGILNNGGLDANSSYPIAFSICGGVCVAAIGWMLAAVH